LPIPKSSGRGHSTLDYANEKCTPAHVADQLDSSLSEGYEALSYYYAHAEEMRAFERENEGAFERIHESALSPEGTIQ
jgi:hypothetical protein